MFSKMEYTLVSLIYKFTQFSIMFQYLWVAIISSFCCHLYFLNKFLNLKSIFLHNSKSQHYSQAS